MQLLQQETSLQEIVQLVGSDALPEKERLTLEIARMIREGFLQQSAYHPVDSYCSLKKQYNLLKSSLKFGELAVQALEAGASLPAIISLDVKTKLIKAALIDEKNFENEIKKLNERMVSDFKGLVV